jgi:hypothetical protein
MSRSIIEIVNICEKKINMVILQELPEPDCPRKKEHNKWKIGEVKKELSARLGGLGITVSITT